MSQEDFSFVRQQILKHVFIWSILHWSLIIFFLLIYLNTITFELCSETYPARFSWCAFIYKSFKVKENKWNHYHVNETFYKPNMLITAQKMLSQQFNFSLQLAFFIILLFNLRPRSTILGYWFPIVQFRS